MKKMITLLAAFLILVLCILPCYADSAAMSDSNMLLTASASDMTEPSDTLPDGRDRGQDLDESTAIIGSGDGPTDIVIAESDDGSFHPENFISNLYYMGVGMVGIFIVIGIIVLATILLNKIFGNQTKKGESR